MEALTEASVVKIASVDVVAAEVIPLFHGRFRDPATSADARAHLSRRRSPVRVRLGVLNKEPATDLFLLCVNAKGVITVEVGQLSRATLE